MLKSQAESLPWLLAHIAKPKALLNDRSDLMQVVPNIREIHNTQSPLMQFFDYICTIFCLFFALGESSLTKILHKAISSSPKAAECGDSLH